MVRHALLLPLAFITIFLRPFIYNRSRLVSKACCSSASISYYVVMRGLRYKIPLYEVLTTESEGPHHRRDS